MTNGLQAMLMAMGTEIENLIEREVHERLAAVEAALRGPSRAAPPPLTPSVAKVDGRRRYHSPEYKARILAEIKSGKATRVSILKREHLSAATVWEWQSSRKRAGGEKKTKRLPPGATGNATTPSGRKIWTPEFKRQILAKGANLDSGARSLMLIEEGVAKGVQPAHRMWAKWKAWAKANPA